MKIVGKTVNWKNMVVRVWSCEWCGLRSIHRLDVKSHEIECKEREIEQHHLDQYLTGSL